MSLIEIKKEIEKSADPEKARILQGFFKTGKGEYGEGDIFRGIKVPIERQIAKKYPSLSLKDIQSLLESKYHEERMIALLILIFKYSKSSDYNKAEIFNFYIKNTKYINNWDLVDLSCHKIIGDYLLKKDRSILYKLVKSNSLWEKRISIISTFAFIKHDDFADSLRLAEILLNDKHDLIHKAVGWTLREIGKKDISVLENFLKQHYKVMPRTALRYSIERLPEKQRKAYLNGEV